MENACGRAFVIRNKDAIQDPSVVTGMFLVNNLVSIILFDSGDGKSSVTRKFNQLLNHEIRKLEVAYEVDVENGQIESTTRILIYCTLNLNGHGISNKPHSSAYRKL